VDSSLYQGTVTHSRFTPVKHSFTYKITLFWLKLDEIEKLNKEVSFFSSNKPAWVRFKQTDYLDNDSTPLESQVRNKMSTLSGMTLKGDVYMLGQLRTLGMYFSPVNFYFLRHKEQTEFSHMLAEVSNTPWGEKHCYLVDMAAQEDNKKVFHVSPFNPIDMQYRWNVNQPNERFAMRLSCIRGEKHFEAGLSLSRQPLTSQTLRKALLKVPSFTLMSLIGIYWQALKLFIKGAPIYDHPNKGTKTV
jgi:DUF1365 family protein